MIPEDVLAVLPPDAATLLRSLRQRFASMPNLAQRFEARGPRRGDIVLSHTGLELARVALRGGAYPRLVLGEVEGEEIRGLAQAQAAAAKVAELAAQRQAKLPQLDLFRKS